MSFKKYEEQKGYHWRQYVRGTKYRKHVDFIKKWVTESKLLDIGAGDGVITYKLRAVGIEKEYEALKIAQAVGADVRYGDAYQLHIADNAFDACLMIDVIEHFEHPEKALAEAWRVAPVLYIATPERGMVRDKYHVKEWTRQELPEFMALNGFALTGDVIVNEETKSMYARFNHPLPNA